MNDKANFVETGHYHVYNKTYNQFPLFQNEDNKKYFLTKLKYFIDDFAFLNAYALLGNHFHLLVYIKPIDQIVKNIKAYKTSKRTKKMETILSSNEKEESLHELLVHQFSRFFNSYTKSYNKAHDNEGPLFKDSFKRSHLTTNERLSFIFYYIHHNFRKHRLNNFLDNGLDTSYQSIVNENDSYVNYKFAFEWFGNKQEFIKFHKQDIDF